MIRIEPVSEKTFGKAVDMKLSPEQNRFVAPNVVSPAQAWLYYDETKPFAILNDDIVVGFIMLDWDENERSVGIRRFMIAPEHQHKGYGRAALESVIEMVKKENKFDLIHLDYVEGNTVAGNLYYSFGFRENGDVDNDEIIMVLPITDSPKMGMLTADNEDLDGIIGIINGKHTKSDICDSELIRNNLDNGNVIRFTIMGKTVGIAIGNDFVLSDEFEYLKDDIISRLKMQND